LGETSARRRAEDDGGEPPHSGPPTRNEAGSELGRQVTVDLQADADLDEGRSGPGHWSLSPGAIGTAAKLGRLGRGRKRVATGVAPLHARSSDREVARDRKRKTGPLRVRVPVCRRAGRQSPSRGEQLTVRRLRSGRMGNRPPPVSRVWQRPFL